MQYHFSKTYSNADHSASDPKPAFKTITAAELMKRPRRERRDPLPGIISEGVTVLAGMPKQGKSRVLTAIATAVASGKPFAGIAPGRQGRVLLLALEEDDDLMIDRLEQFDGTLARKCRKLDITFELDGTPADAVSTMRDWAQKHKDAALVIIDIWEMFNRQTRSARTYTDQYKALSLITEFSKAYDIPVVAVMHTTKIMTRPGDIRAVTGTIAQVAAPSTIVIIREQNAVIEMYVTSRRMRGGQYNVAFDESSHAWRQVSKPAEVTPASPTGKSDKVLALFKTPDQVIASADIRDAVFDGNANAAAAHLSRMVRDGALLRAEKGKYRLPVSAT